MRVPSGFEKGPSVFSHFRIELLARGESPWHVRNVLCTFRCISAMSETLTEKRPAHLLFNVRHRYCIEYSKQTTLVSVLNLGINIHFSPPFHQAFTYNLQCLVEPSSVSDARLFLTFENLEWNLKTPKGTLSGLTRM